MVQGVLNVALRAAQNGGAKRILAVYVKIGAYSDVIPSYMDECFKLLSRDTMAQGAKLVVEEIPVTIRCNACGIESGVARRQTCCPVCGSQDITMLTGRECFVDRLEAE
ncbi:MAG: hydrogenase maturation nickel metallochaperone HypA [Clostridiales bacterium]|nr:hydrogenase maturation nickel metallochaperone HypA [Candidatus Cacconaster stercorequi]